MGSRGSTTLHGHFALQETQRMHGSQQNLFTSSWMCCATRCRYIHLHALLLPHNPAWDIPFPTPEYLHSSSWVQNPQDCISESGTELTLPARPIYSSPPIRLPRTTACFLYFIKANRWCSSVEKHLWKGCKERQEFGSGRRSIFILHLQLLVHIYISICTPIFIKT